MHNCNHIICVIFGRIILPGFTLIALMEQSYVADKYYVKSDGTFKNKKWQDLSQSFSSQRRIFCACNHNFDPIPNLRFCFRVELVPREWVYLEMNKVVPIHPSSSKRVNLFVEQYFSHTNCAFLRI